MKNLKSILLVEDDRVDIMTVQRALRDLGITNTLACSGDGVEALEYLRNKDNEKPCVILLDLNMPRMNGTEFLKVIKTDNDLKDIPVVALTTSKKEQDIAECFKLGVAGYVVKVVDYKKFLEAIKIIDLYWTLSEIPTEN